MHHEHTCEVLWQRAAGEPFVDSRYSRKHTWHFDGGLAVAASASPLVVAVPMSEPHAVDPEEAFVASIASCHMLWFLALAAKAGCVVNTYRDCPVGWMDRDHAGQEWIAKVFLRPRIVFDGEEQPARDAVAALHHEAHKACFIARSVKSEIVISLP